MKKNAKTKKNVREKCARKFNAQEQFETIWNFVESGIAIVDAETREILDINPAALRLFNGTKEMVIGKRCQNVFCPAQKCPILELNQVVDRSERKFVKSDGTVIPIIKSVAKITYDGRPALLENFTDLSPMKEAEEKNRMLEIAEQANKAKSAFLSNMSHEIRTPMNAIIGMTSIGMSAADTDKKNYCFERIDDASKHLLGIINDILDMSKIEANKFELSPVEFDFEKMLRRVVRISQKKQNLKVHIDSAIPKILYGDEQHLAQVVTNLVGNAVKFTPETGSISIDTKFLKEENNICSIQISVSDTGIGLSHEQQEHLFHSFQQAENSTSRKFGGTGLGLAISKNIVEMMGGRIWIESELGKGATFAFTFQAKRIEGKEKKLRDWSNIRALAIDDDPVNLEYLRKTMLGFSASCDTVSSAEEALRLIARNGNYDIYFVDLSLPGIDSVKLTNTLKTQKKDTDKVFVIMMSSVNWSLIDEDAKSAGIDKFLSKPLSPSAIEDAVNDCLGVEQQQNEDAAQHEVISFEGRHILLAEDIEINREIVKALLEPAHLTIDCAKNGEEAVQMFSKAPDKYDMIFMDVQMPEMDGYEATRRIRALQTPKAVNIPIIAMTANVFREDIEKCLAAGMNNHVGKPLNFNEILDKLKTYLPQKNNSPHDQK
ncbi:MAG: response regulator [Endomicrobia bacterium]|nr:response regulator [Endomicrobiia bacterium]